MLRSIIAASLLAMNAPPPTPTDYTVCGKVRNGPIRPQLRENGTAPLADVV